METSHRLKQAKSIPEDRKIQDGDPRINKNILEYRGMGDINRPTRRLPPYSNSPKIPKIPAVCTQVSDISVHLSSIRASPAQVFTMIVKEVKLMPLSWGIRIHQYLDDWLIRAQSLEQSSHNTKVVVDLTESLGWMINQVKSELIPTRSILVCGIRIPSKLSPCKAHSGEVAKTTGINPQDNQPVCPDCKTFDVSH